MLRDITVRKQKEAELYETGEQLRPTFEHAPIRVAIVGLDGHWIRVNQALCSIFGYSAAELLRRTFQDIRHPDDIGADAALIRQLIDGQIASFKLGKRDIRKNGSVVEIMLHVSIVRDEGGHGDTSSRRSKTSPIASDSLRWASTGPAPIA